MIHEKIELNVKGAEETAYLYTYFLDNSPETGTDRRRPVIVLCPGGGYEMTSDREAEGVAMQFLAAGCHAVVLRYSVWPAVYPAALLQLAQTVLYLRENADTYHIDRNRVIVQGSSAGGHLAASLGVFWNRPFLSQTLETDSLRLRPDALLLCYPVITSGTKCHEGSFRHLLGERLEELREDMSLEKQVTAETPQTFLWHTAVDDCVPVENSLLFLRALLDRQVPAELHVYPVGGHGLSLATEETACPNGYGIQEECQSWLPLALSWIRHLIVNRPDEKG